MNDHSLPLLPGENSIRFAPTATLPNGKNCVPQHFLEYDHNLPSVEKLLEKITFDERYPVFAAEEQGQLYLQIGVIGPDNYDRNSPSKIVYGRKWRIERDLPSTEIVQTVFLAIQKAREHELRERLVLEVDGVKTTPFNNHHDLPMMAKNPDLFLTKDHSRVPSDIKKILSCFTYDGARLSVKELQQLDTDLYWVQLHFSRLKAGLLEEIDDGTVLNVLVPNLSVNTLLHQTIKGLVERSNSWVAEHFKFEGFARFSQQVDALAIAHASALTRNLSMTDQIECEHSKMQYDVDGNRVPNLAASEYSGKLRNQLQKFEPLAGFKPVFLDSKAG